MTDTSYSTSGDSGAADTLAKAKEAASQAMDTAKQQAGQVASSVQSKAKDTLEHGKQTASQTLVDFAGAIRKAGDELAQHDQSLAGRLVKQAADGLEGLSHAVADKRPDELLDAVRDLGRRNPGAVVAGAVLVGLALGRFAKSSAKHDGGMSAGSNGPRPTLPSSPLAVGSDEADRTSYGSFPEVEEGRIGGVTAIGGGSY